MINEYLNYTFLAGIGVPRSKLAPVRDSASFCKIVRHFQWPQIIAQIYILVRPDGYDGTTGDKGRLHRGTTSSSKNDN